MAAILAQSDRRGRIRPGRTRRVLVLDEDAWCRAIANGALRAHGHRVFCMGASETAVGIAREMMPDLVLADVSLPLLELAPLDECRRTDSTRVERFPRVSPSYAILRALEADPVPNDRVVVLLKECVDGAGPASALRFGVLEYVVKPFTPRGLVERVENALATLPRAAEAPRAVARLRDEPAFDGHIGFVGVTAILEMLHLNQLSGVVTFRTAANHSAEIVFREGEIAAAATSSGLEGVVAVYQVLAWTSGRFCFVPRDSTPKQHLGLNFEQVLLEGLRRLDESRRGALSQSLLGVGEKPSFFTTRES